MSILTIPAYAKINLFLEITGKRPDGFHDIDSVMHSVSLCDDLSIEINGSGEVTLDCPALDIPQEKNIAWKAACLYLDRAEITDGVHIEIEKRIPWEAGLGGGSSDAGAVLRGLNSIYKRFDINTLCAIGAEIGSDIPFCVRGGCMRALGRGEILSPLPILPDCHILLARGGVGSSTAAAYKAADTAGFVPRTDELADIIGKGNIKLISDKTFNRFEDTAPYAAPIKEIMLSCGALTSMLTGSGSAVFGIFDDLEKAKDAADRLDKNGYWTALCAPMGEF